MSTNDKLKDIFANLGRATLRGIKKCPKCGMYNGTRGISCKNKKCDVVFKEIGLKRKLSSDAVKLLTGTTTQVYSVRVRDRGPDHRGFVQLPYIQTHLSSIDLDPTINLINESAALCFVDTCQRSFDTTILKCHESEHSSSVTSCPHVLAAIKCVNEATPLIVRNSVLSSLNVSNEIKQELWLLATETVGPLVQRVSKNTMAVKCQTSPKCPLGYLHLSFIITKMKDRTEHKYFCGCNDFKGSPGHINKIQNTISDVGKTSELLTKKCIHYYACICAFASDNALSEEFDYYVKQEKPVPVSSQNLTQTVDILSDDLTEVVNDTLAISQFSIFNTDFVPSSNSCNIEVLTDEGYLDITNMVVTEFSGDTTMQNEHLISQQKSKNDDAIVIKRNIENEILNLADLTQNYKETFSDVLDSTYIDINELKRMPSQTLKTYAGSKKQKIDATNAVVPTTTPIMSDVLLNRTSHLTVNNNIKINNCNNNNNNNNNNIRKSKKSQTLQVIDEKTTSLSFLEWLASVTEMINETMHFQSDGKPEPLKFTIPQSFFECLRERISLGFSKKRLPNFTQTEIRRDKPPFGTFTKYIWHIVNIFHLKQIFETTQISLDITRSFVKNKDGSYSPCNINKCDINYYTTNGFIPIKPLDLKTYLKVGKTSANQKEPTPFIIEWIPDIIPKMKMGELKLTFEFGHSREISSSNDATKRLSDFCLY